MGNLGADEVSASVQEIDAKHRALVGGEKAPDRREIVRVPGDGVNGWRMRIAAVVAAGKSE